MAESIRYSVRNQRMLADSGRNYYVFDVYGLVFTPGLKLGQAYMNLAFNPTTFGVNAVPDFRWKATAGPGIPQDRISISGINTPNNSVIEILIFSPNFIMPADTFLLLTVKLEIGLDTICCRWAGLSFLLTDMLNASAYYTPSNELIYFEVVADAIQDYRLCTSQMAITSVTPLLVHAGNRESLEIRGKGFGNEKGEVLFKNADFGGLIVLAKRRLVMSKRA